MKKLSFSICIFITLMLIITNCAFAANIKAENTKLEVTDKPICTIQINENAIFEKKLTDVDLQNKKLTIEMNIKNNSEKLFKEKTEIFLVIDNSSSMKDIVSGSTTRLESVTSSAKTLASKLLKEEKINVGIVSFSTGKEEGTITDATLKNKPSHIEKDVLTSIDSIANSDLGDRTNIDAGLTLANENFSEDCQNRYIVLLSDGVPNTAVGGPILTYSGEVAAKTKKTLTSIANNNTEIFTVLTGVPNSTEPSSNKTYKELAEEIFGTPEKPTVGKYYYIQDTDIEKTITQDIFSSIVDTSANDLNNINIYDYFPQEIVDNFNFSYLERPTMGKISSEIEKAINDNTNTIINTTTNTSSTDSRKNNYILWEIDKLGAQESATVTYQLSIKPEINQDIIGIVLNTNKEVNILALDNSTLDTVPPTTDNNGNKYNVNTTSQVSPKIKLTAIKDTTIANNEIPQTGDSNFDITTFAFIGIIVIAIVLTTIKIYSSKY